MLRIDQAEKTLAALQKKSLREAGYWERRDLQRMIRRAPEAFRDELGEFIWFAGEEVAPASEVQDRIDLLGIDADGTAIVIELKRDSHKLHLLQALSYAAMIAHWQPKRFIEELAKYNGNQTFEAARDELLEQLQVEDIEAINRKQRIVLLAEAFDFEVLATAEWLTERYDMDIRCYRLALATSGTEHFLTCTRVYPPPEITELAVKRRRKREVGSDDPATWAEALAAIKNKAVAAFFRSELDQKRPNNLGSRLLRFYIDNRRRFTVFAKANWARVLQAGRFDDDVQFWRDRLGDKDSVAVTGNSGEKLRFYLNDESDLKAFKFAVENELSNKEFISDGESDEADEAAE